MRLVTSLIALACALAPLPAMAGSYRDRQVEDEVIYFLLPDRFENGDAANDRGGIAGDRLAHGFDPAHKGFYHGGDLKGLVNKLDYIQTLGATAIWLGPIFKNKAVQGRPGEESSGYHGYWVTDFTTIDPHLGTEADFKAFVDAAHKRGMKVYMDIITNHTADVISYKECPDFGCAYRSRADYPYSRRAADGAAINAGFAGDSVRTTRNFGKLTDMNFAYSVTVPAAEAAVKKPAWLNDPAYYHNRGNSTFRGESSQMGDFSGLDDLMTEHPRVVQGMIDIYGAWIDRYKIDGFRIDTAKHVNPEFWVQFAPAMLKRAKANGIPNFHIFGEVASGEFEPELTADWSHSAQLPAVLDFAFRTAIERTIAGSASPELLVKLYSVDKTYRGGEAAALTLPTFISNHDLARIGYFLRKVFPAASEAELLKRAELAHALMFVTRGVPTVYSGDEQGFTGDGGDQDAREDMFPSLVSVYNDNKLIGTSKTTADDNFDEGHPLFQAVTALAKLRKDHVALRRGVQIIRNYDEKPGLFAFSRIDLKSGSEIVAVFNTGTTALDANVEIDSRTARLESLRGSCPASIVAPGKAHFALPPLGYVVCAAK